ncbi:hypothetical protein VA596_41505 [Amycolatopsis sp., V23-08]|uniref:Uncharacterized protein n=1 Tax=Amycolatopsis heterodermiae TaxID=3110235 RepID=A0ABU5RIR4_9PSEU|nr:hypothetical protein [Amycolatopsis sp., V23-08]MEA5366063.1 hypothetical protein [Amycolatopsis sp., V23-08]
MADASGAVRRTPNPPRDDHAEIIIPVAQPGAGAEKIAPEGKDTDTGVSDRERLAELIESVDRAMPPETFAAPPLAAGALADAILAAGWRPELPDEASARTKLADLRAWVDDHRGLGEAIGLAFGDTYAGETFSDPTFERGSTAIVAVVQEWLDEHPPQSDRETEDACPHCSPTHERPESRPWGVYVAPFRDGDGQPTHLVVQPSNGAHVAQSDADWLWQVIREWKAAQP